MIMKCYVLVKFLQSVAVIVNVANCKFTSCKKIILGNVLVDISEKRTFQQYPKILLQIKQSKAESCNVQMSVG